MHLRQRNFLPHTRSSTMRPPGDTRLVSAPRAWAGPPARPGWGMPTAGASMSALALAPQIGVEFASGQHQAAKLELVN
eukprot:7712658-Pyramimonas_sp.AAC.1